MSPEVISNGLASLQQGRLRYVKSVQIDFTPHGQRTSVRFANGAIKVRRRFTYEEVTALLDASSPLSPVLGGGGCALPGASPVHPPPYHPPPPPPPPSTPHSPPV